MEFDELKTKMEAMGFTFAWCDEDIEGTEENEDKGKEREVKIHATGWWMKPPPDYNYPRVFVPFDDPRKKSYLTVMLERYELIHDRDEEEARMMRDFEERFNAKRHT